MNNTYLHQITSNVSEINNDELLNVVNKFNNSFNIQINIDNILDAVIELMKLVGKLKKIKGHDKKYIVTKLLLHIVENTDSGRFDEVLDAILINIIPIAIDKLILVENNKLKFNKSVNCFSCFS